MATDVPRAAPFQFVVNEAIAVDIGHEDAMPKFGRPIVALINHRPRVRVSSSQLAMFALAAARFGPVVSGKMFVIRTGAHQRVQIGIEILPEHSLIVSAGNEMPEVTNDVVGKESLPVFVPIEAPRVGCAIDDYFENVASRMIAPNAAIEFDALLIGRAGSADQ